MKFIVANTLALGSVVLLYASLSGKALFIALFALIFLYALFIAVASFSFRLNFFLTAIHKGIPGKIVLTFDDGPHPENTPAILEALRRYNARATFFLIGGKAEAHPVVVKEIIKDKHEIGNHSFTHSKLHGFFSASRVKNEIEKTNTALQSIAGNSPSYYRPPFGVTNPNIARAVKMTGMKTVGWDLRSYDTVITDVRKLSGRIISNIPKSTILLLHDSEEVTVKILPQILDFCKNHGIEIVPLSEAIKNKL